MTTTTLTPVQQIVLNYIGEHAVTMADLCSALEQSTRYVRYTIERAALELVELGVLVQEGNFLMTADVANTGECAPIVSEECASQVWYY